MGIEFEGQHNDILVANPSRPQLPPKRFEFEHVFKPSAGQSSRRRDCHCAGIPSSSLLKRLLKGEGGAAE